MSSITYNSRLKCFEDEDGNKAYTAWFGSPEQAKLALQSLEGCAKLRQLRSLRKLHSLRKLPPSKRVRRTYSAYTG